jgi:hypothetical protein
LLPDGPRAPTYPVGAWDPRLGLRSSFTHAGYLDAVARVREYILAGDIFQANLSQRFEAPCTEPAWSFYRRLRAHNPAPFAAFMELPDAAVVSASPERFLHVDPAGHVETRPIKGTRARGFGPEHDAALGQALIKRYTTRFTDELSAIDASVPSIVGRLEAYANLYASVLEQERFCLCGMLAAEYDTLPETMRDAVIDFFDKNEAWLTHGLELGREHGELAFAGSAVDEARLIVGGLEGAMLVARPYRDVTRFQAAAVQLLLGLRNTATTTP